MNWSAVWSIVSLVLAVVGGIALYFTFLRKKNDELETKLMEARKELDMLNVLCVCGNGMGTSTILKINVKKICDANKIDAIVDSCAFSEAMTYLFNTDIVLTSPEWAEMLPPSNAHIVKMKNLVDMQEISDKLLAEVKENFPEEWNG